LNAQRDLLFFVLVSWRVANDLLGKLLDFVEYSLLLVVVRDEMDV
jgi:hypothetical protein